jgi:hypothetical protein
MKRKHWNYSPRLPKLSNWPTLCFYRTQRNKFKYKALSTLLISGTLLTVSWKTYSQVMTQVKWILNGHTLGCPKFIKAKKGCSLSYWNNVFFKLKLSTVETQQLNPQLTHGACILTIARPYFLLLNIIIFFHECYRSMRINIWAWCSISDRQFQFQSIYQSFISWQLLPCISVYFNWKWYCVKNWTNRLTDKSIAIITEVNMCTAEYNININLSTKTDTV